MVRHIGRAHPILPLFILQYSPSSYRGHTGTDDTWARVEATTRSAYPAKRPGDINCRRVHSPNDRHPAYDARPRKATRGRNKGARSGFVQITCKECHLTFLCVQRHVVLPAPLRYACDGFLHGRLGGQLDGCRIRRRHLQTLRLRRRLIQRSSDR